jgi:hypothetical protein
MRSAPSNDTPIFVRVGDHGNAFARYHKDGRPWPLARDEAMFNDPSSAHYRAASAPSNFQPAPDLPPISAAGTGTRDQGNGNGGGMISKQLASQIHDMAFKAGVDESSMDGLARALARITGTDPVAADKGGGKISVDKANRAWKVARDAGLNPQDLADFVELLRPFVDPSLEDEDETAQDQPAFKGMPKPGGQVVGDAARSFDAEFPNVRRLAASDTHFGDPCPMRPKGSVHQQRLALDARERADGASGYLGGDAELDASVRRIGRCY